MTRNKTSILSDFLASSTRESSQGTNLRPLLPAPRPHPVGTHAGHRTAPSANSESPVTGDSGIWWQESSPHSPLVEQDNLEVLQKLAIRGPSINRSQGIKPTASKKQRQYICEANQIDELWRDRNHIHEAVYDLGKLGDRLQGWNKHQMDAVQNVSTHHSGRYQQEAEKIKMP